MSPKEEIAERVIKDDATGVRELTQRATEGAILPQEILKECLVIALEEVGRRYEEGDYLIPSMLVAGPAMNQEMCRRTPPSGSNSNGPT